MSTFNTSMFQSIKDAYKTHTDTIEIGKVISKPNKLKTDIRQVNILVFICLVINILGWLSLYHFDPISYIIVGRDI